MQLPMYRPSHKTVTVGLRHQKQYAVSKYCFMQSRHYNQTANYQFQEQKLYTGLQNCATFIFAISLDSVD